MISSISSMPDWISNLLSDTQATDICINGVNSVFVDRGYGMARAEAGASTELEIKNWVLAELSAQGKSWDARFPFVDGVISTGHRMHVAFPPVAQVGITVSLRRLRFPPSALTAKDRWSTSPLFNVLRDAYQAGQTILVAGSTGSGKTTLATDLLSAVPDSERILALEDTPELKPDHPQFLTMLSRPANADGFGEITLRELLKQALRMRPDRIVLGECRGAEVLDLLQALNTGHRGSLATLHANSPRDALRRLELLCLLASHGSIPVTVIRELIATGLEWVCHVAREKTGRIIREAWRIEGREGDTILLRPVLKGVG